MGALFSTLMSLLNSKQEHKLIIVGLDNAGKTTSLYKLCLGEVVLTQPTIGSNVEEVRYKNVVFEVWDLGGQTTLRQSWASYYRNTAAVIMMVDSTDRGRMGLVRDELFRLLSNEELDPKGVLVLANKQDLPDAMSVADLSEALNLHAIQGHEWHIQASCALTGEGLWEGLDWVSARCAGGAS
jgi:ADP-ribosylation factor-like protein 5B